MTDRQPADDDGPLVGEGPRPPDEDQGASHPDGADDEGDPWADLGYGLPLDFNLSAREGASVPALPERRPDEFFVLAPGEEIAVMSSFPKPRHLPTALVVGTGLLGLFDRTGRVWCRTPSGGATDHLGEPVAMKLALAVVRRPSPGPDGLAPPLRQAAAHTGAPPVPPSVRRDKSPHRYLVALDHEGNPIGALDNRPPEWELMPGQIEQMVESVGVAFSAERFYSNEEFFTAHPDWLG